MQRGIDGNSLICFVIFFFCFLLPLFFCYVDIVLQLARLCTVPPKKKKNTHLCFNEQNNVHLKKTKKKTPYDFLRSCV